MRLLLILLMSIVIVTGCSSAPPAEGDAAPNFSLQTMTDDTLNLADYKGQRVMLNFWATWCGPCREELPHMQQVYAAQSDAAVIALNMTDQDYGTERIEAFIEEFSLTFPIPLDETGDVAKQYGVITIPTTFFIDEEGHITDKVSGPLTVAQIDAYMGNK